MSDKVDIKTLEILANQIEKDARTFHALHPAAMRSVAEIIFRAIGAPISWPAREAGAVAAEEYYPGAPDLRHGFNAGVKWAVEKYQGTEIIENRFGDK